MAYIFAADSMGLSSFKFYAAEMRRYREEVEKSTCLQGSNFLNPVSNNEHNRNPPYSYVGYFVDRNDNS